MLSFTKRPLGLGEDPMPETVLDALVEIANRKPGKNLKQCISIISELVESGDTMPSRTRMEGLRIALRVPGHGPVVDLTKLIPWMIHERDNLVRVQEGHGDIVRAEIFLGSWHHIAIAEVHVETKRRTPRPFGKHLAIA